MYRRTIYIRWSCVNMRTVKWRVKVKMETWPWIDRGHWLERITISSCRKHKRNDVPWVCSSKVGILQPKSVTVLINIQDILCGSKKVRSTTVEVGMVYISHTGHSTECKKGTLYYSRNRSVECWRRLYYRQNRRNTYNKNERKRGQWSYENMSLCSFRVTLEHSGTRDMGGPMATWKARRCLFPCSNDLSTANQHSMDSSGSEASYCVLIPGLLLFPITILFLAIVDLGYNPMYLSLLIITSAWLRIKFRGSKESE